ncbi:hypothetical protein COOONC_06411 [Cooperia oncophora]
MSDDDMPMDADTERLLQAEHDDSCMRELAHLLDVDTMQVVPQQSAVSSSAVPNPAAIEQLNRFEFEPVDYHATFDPIAAAQARKDEQAAAEAEGVPLDNPDTRAPRSKTFSKRGGGGHIRAGEDRRRRASEVSR